MSLLRSNLQVELVAAFSEAKKETRELRLTQQARLILDAPDVESAAAAMSTKNFCIGAGDRSAFLKMVLETDPHDIPDLYRKL